MTTELTYRRTSIAGASPLGLMIALLDTMVGDFRRAADALRKNDIETRCREMNHAALVLGQLESWVDLKNGGESAQTLARFYSYLRAKMMQAAVEKSASVLEAQIDSVLHVRSAWQQLDAAPPPAPEEPAEEANEQANVVYARATDIMADRIPFSQSA
ncbi:MAG: flagellar export chaperone FliS [Terracidiphilus sp.]|jgi:flagellar protein FliS